MIGKPGRPGFNNVTPYLMVERVAPVLAFLEHAFGAQEVYRTTGGAGGTHLEVEIGDSKVMLGGDTPGGNASVPVCLFVYVEDTDAVYARALEAGASEMLPPGENFQEARGAAVVDPFGNQWFIGTHAPSAT